MKSVVYGVFTEDGLDQVCSLENEARREVKALQVMGCKTMVLCGHELDFDAAHDIIRDGGSFAKARKVFMQYTKAREDAAAHDAAFKAAGGREIRVSYSVSRRAGVTFTAVAYVFEGDCEGLPNTHTFKHTRTIALEDTKAEAMAAAVQHVRDAYKRNDLHDIAKALPVVDCGRVPFALANLMSYGRG
jgi:hypothetical protein